MIDDLVGVRLKGLYFYQIYEKFLSNNYNRLRVVFKYFI